MMYVCVEFRMVARREVVMSLMTKNALDGLHVIRSQQ